MTPETLPKKQRLLTASLQTENIMSLAGQETVNTSIIVYIILSYFLLRMWNLVTEQWIGADQTCEWYNSIQEFTAIPRWIPKGCYHDIMIIMKYYA